jgi:hypothetical protein
MRNCKTSKLVEGQSADYTAIHNARKGPSPHPKLGLCLNKMDDFLIDRGQDILYLPNKSSNSCRRIRFNLGDIELQNDLVFNKKRNCSHFTGYSYGYLLDSRLVLPSTGGVAGAYVCWMQLSGDGHSKYLPGRPTAF